jgi:hypothetical protein
MEEQIEIQKHFRNQQEKYTYYLIALCVSAIGFSVFIAIGRKLSYSQIPLGISILAWGLSIFFGFKLIEMLLKLLSLNNEYFEVIKGNNPISGTHPEKIKIGIDTILRIIDQGNQKAGNYKKLQYSFLLLGMISFLTWIVIEMYLKK